MKEKWGTYNTPNNKTVAWKPTEAELKEERDMRAWVLAEVRKRGVPLIGGKMP
jgi:hypothetical protein